MSEWRPSFQRRESPDRQEAYEALCGLFEMAGDRPTYGDEAIEARVDALIEGEPDGKQRKKQRRAWRKATA